MVPANVVGRGCKPQSIREPVYGDAVSDDDRQRRRMGDATRDRIAKLENGWSIPDEDQEITEKKAEPVKPRAPTDPAEIVPTTPFDRSPEPELLEAVPTTTTPPEALEVLRGAAARRSDSEIQ